jgi:predicted RNA-binding protein YlqC (UPF0109 family)
MGGEAAPGFHQNAFQEHGMAYFGPGMIAMNQQESVADAHILPHSQQAMTSGSTNSPPPSSATTSGSISTPTSCISEGKQAIHSPPFAHPEQQPGGPIETGMAPIALQRHIHSVPTVCSSEEPSVSQSPGTPPRNPSAYLSAIKLLVSNNVAGSIIGRAGQTISELQSQSFARIKLSQTGDFYPGTQDRVCLVQGQIDTVKVAMRLLLERLYVLQEHQHSQQIAWQRKEHDDQQTSYAGFDFAVRILVPSSSCGMIIGKSGSNIKKMEEASGVSSVRLSPKESPDSSSPSSASLAATSERIVTLTGPTFDSCLMCLHIILEAMMVNQETSRYSNMTTSYSRVLPVHATFPMIANAVPDRPVMAVPIGSAESPMWDVGSQYTHQFAPWKRSNSSPDLIEHLVWDQQHGVAHLPPDGLKAPVSSRRAPSRVSIQHHNAMFADGPLSGPSDVPPMPAGRSRLSIVTPPQMVSIPLTPTNHVDPGSIPSSLSAPDLLAIQHHESLRLESSPLPPTTEYTHFVPQLPQPAPPGFSAQILVPDSMVGSILGRGGRTLNELQMHSGTRIRISQRGEFVPRTRNRIVTVRGPTAQSVSLAQYLMNQRMVVLPTSSYSGQPRFHPSHVLPDQDFRSPQDLSSQQRSGLQAVQFPNACVDSPNFQGTEAQNG